MYVCARARDKLSGQKPPAGDGSWHICIKRLFTWAQLADNGSLLLLFLFLINSSSFQSLKRSKIERNEAVAHNFFFFCGKSSD